MSPGRYFGSEVELRRYEALLQLADVMVRHCDVGELFHELTERLHQIAVFELAGVCLHDPLKNTLSLRVWEGGQPGSAPMELPMADTTAGWVWENQQALAFPDVQTEARFSTCLDMVRKMGMHSFCELPLTTRQRRLGTLSLGSSQPNLYDESEWPVLRGVAQMVALSLENVTSRTALQHETDRLQMLLEINAILVSNSDISEVFPAISESLSRVVKHDHAGILLYDSSTQSLRKYALVSPCAKELLAHGSSVPLKNSPSGRAFLAMEPKIYSHEELLSMPQGAVPVLLHNGIISLCCIPMVTGKGPLGTLNLGSRQEHAFLPQDMGLLKQLASQLAIALDNSRAHREVAQLKDKLAEEKRYLQGEIHSTVNFEEIIGESPVLEDTLHKAKTVAPSDATVLILGETGTGKELLARAIHRMSPRKDANFIKLNCAAIPTGLLESELFGHEKGAFTGAISQKVGRLELADKGTLLLDEVGDIPLELQPKLLRVLQDREFERLGGTRTIRVNIRLIAATNRDLAARVEEREFRSDLYYRLNVFPIRMPALRERKTDIPLLVRYFVEKFSQKMNKQIERIPEETIHALQGWGWPGNIRELENFIERSVILSDGLVLKAPLGELAGPSTNLGEGTLLALERDHIVRALRDAGGVIAGTHGAAVRLGVKRTTLQSMIIRFHIMREEYSE
jgi:formate hydrogenlyase transcriptional activator